MPMRDKTGPDGTGAGTGRGMGSCGQGKTRSAGLGRGFGRVMCGRRFQRYQTLTPDEKKEVLSQEREDLREELNMVEEEIASLDQ